MADDLSWLLTDFSRATAGVRDAMLVSADGLKLATSPDLDPELSDQLAAASSGLVSLARGTAALLDAGPVSQTILEMDRGYLFVTAITQGASLAVHAERNCDMGSVGYEMTLLAARVGHALAPQTRAAAGDRSR
ncbi:roadblock/LC7 domain-containing protein [Pseudonocardia humida]|uniref:Roadblock/LC7 domain-containing protein n=1 Tax=Pseudonocardia humida TaxID=2800819 RepID=A0ABT0ZVM1_9PSEU|nr:roadblock/LC7 domain-containing protein [Pseudonocardia humida]MCO1654782.1 roadblock/LC7 domain-containing protein [Pseudonocardia humida]